MSLGHTILMNAFGRPKGVLGRLGGHILAHTNAEPNAWVCELLAVQSTDRVLEVGFGPGVAIARLAELAPAGYIAGVDISREMLAQAHSRNLAAVERGLVDLRQASVERLPFEDDTFDKALALNSMQIWRDAVGGLRELRRVCRRGATIALGFTSHAGQSKEALAEAVQRAGFADMRIVDGEKRFCALLINP
ncbi:MAG TPA: class I SAM-dependent methyltransferase [Stellaceae bacterium]|nr:class I SAM-dependent methyltransferase [Stellaceae bacterium]